MNTIAFEQFLAKIYVDHAARERFLADPQAEAARAGLSEEQCHALEAIDRVGLKMAARSFARKRALKHPRATRNLWNRWRSRQDT
jgi:hypothetical protein